MTHQATRRAMLTTAVSVAAIPALALVPANAADHDAELWRHAEAILALWPEHERLSAIAIDAGHRLHRFAKEKMENFVGSDDARDGKLIELLKYYDLQTGHSEKEDAFIAIQNQVEAHTRAIEKIPARTLRGLAAKAIAAGTAFPGEWDSPIEDCDWDNGRARSLIDSILETAGVANPFIPAA